MKKLTQLRTELKVPKDRYNKFANFNYRNQEDILDAVKPLLVKHGLGLSITDDMIMLGERFYVKASVEITGDDEPILATGFAREPLSKKGMDEPQISGTASSYARKYALNALFLIDDVKDSDNDAIVMDSGITPDIAIKKITACKTLDELKVVWTEVWSNFEGDIASKQVLTDMKDKKKAELS